MSMLYLSLVIEFVILVVFDSWIDYAFLRRKISYQAWILLSRGANAFLFVFVLQVIMTVILTLMTIGKS